MRFAIALLLAGLSGFISLSYEILLYRTVSYGLAGSAIAFPMLLGAFLMGIALGARVADGLCEAGEAGAESPLRAIAGFIFASNVLAFATLSSVAYLAGFGVHFVFWLLTIIVTSALLGAQFPLISHFGVDPDERAGQRVSFLYGANIVGSTSGSLLTGVVILDYVSLSATATGLCLAGMSAAVALFATTRPARPRLLAALIALVVASTAAIGLRATLFDKFWERLMFQDEHPGRTFHTVVENKHGVITVDQNDDIYGGGIYDGGFNVLPGRGNHVLRAYAVGLFHPKPKRVLMIGLSSGSWATIVANHPDVEELVVVEINPGYLEVLERYEHRQPLLDNPKVRIVIDDGRRWLARNPDEKFDAVVANHSHHWRNLASNLLSVEYNDLVANHMNPGGVYLFNTTTSDRVFRTAFETWDHVARFQTCAVVSDKPLEPDTSRWRRELSSWQIWDEPALPGQEGERLIDHFVRAVDEPTRYTPDQDMFSNVWEPQGWLWERVQDARPITDDNMGTEWTDGFAN